MPLVMIKGDNIAYPVVHLRVGFSANFISKEGFFTKYGFIIPLTDIAFNLLDFFETGEWQYAKDEEGPIALIITAEGKLYEFVCAGGIIRKYIPQGEGLVYSRSGLFEADVCARFALDVTDDINEAIKLLCTTVVFSPNWFAFDKISSVVSKLNEKQLTVPIPLHQCNYFQMPALPPKVAT